MGGAFPSPVRWGEFTGGWAGGNGRFRLDPASCAWARCGWGQHPVWAYEGSRDSFESAKKLADDLRTAPDVKLLEKYRCVCNWLSESDGISDFVLRAQDFREMIGFGEWAATGDEYLRRLIGMARETFGMG